MASAGRRDPGELAACLVGDGIGVGPALQRSPDGGGACSESGAREAEGVHDGLGGQLTVVAGGASDEVG